ncbi:hypothetical protein [Lentzea kentuckyensis]|uniref:hypothetical protein n=1 Tax=Lentzea kentuckyensis TaxID=360086 RepID=UPI000A389FD6|nr:hypothetical protein [Lentzea kentuckyensis]
MTSSKSKTGKPPGRSTIEKCLCLNDFQDDLYGKGNRVKNVGVKTLTCTSCSRETLRPVEAKDVKP